MKITFRPPEGSDLVFEVDKPEITIGRSSSCDIVLRLEGISRQHCRIVADEKGALTVEDMGSTNGVFIDNQRIPTGKPTPYAAFLPLSVGNIPVQSIEVATTATQVLKGYRQLKQEEGRTGTGGVTLQLDLPKKPKKAKTVAPAPPPEPQKNVSPLLIVLVVAAMAAGTYFFFLD